MRSLLLQQPELVPMENNAAAAELVNLLPTECLNVVRDIEDGRSRREVAAYYQIDSPTVERICSVQSWLPQLSETDLIEIRTAMSLGTADTVLAQQYEMPVVVMLHIRNRVTIAARRRAKGR